MTTTSKNGKTYEVKQTNGKFFYFSKAMRRWMPVKAALVEDIGRQVNA